MRGLSLSLPCPFTHVLPRFELLPLDLWREPAGRQEDRNGNILFEGRHECLRDHTAGDGVERVVVDPEVDELGVDEADEQEREHGADGEEELPVAADDVLQPQGREEGLERHEAEGAREETARDVVVCCGGFLARGAGGGGVDACRDRECEGHDESEDHQAEDDGRDAPFFGGDAFVAEERELALLNRQEAACIRMVIAYSRCRKPI